MGTNGTHGVRNGRGCPGLLRRKTITAMQTIMNASNVPMFTIFPMSSIGVLWRRIRASLEGIERKALVEQCLRNHEGVQLDRDVWRRTSRALTAVYMDRDDIVAAAHKHEAGFSRATLASRVLVEMAVTTADILLKDLKRESKSILICTKHRRGLVALLKRCLMQHSCRHSKSNTVCPCSN